MTTKEEIIKELKKEARATNLEKVLEEYVAEKARQEVDKNLLKNFNEMFEKKKDKLP